VIQVETVDVVRQILDLLLSHSICSTIPSRARSTVLYTWRCFCLFFQFTDTRGRSRCSGSLMNK
jgi:hypothetical protein